MTDLEKRYKLCQKFGHIPADATKEWKECTTCHCSYQGSILDSVHRLSPQPNPAAPWAHINSKGREGDRRKRLEMQLFMPSGPRRGRQ